MFENQKVDLFSRLLLSCHNLFCWEIKRDFTLQHSNCTMEDIFFPVLKLSVPSEAFERCCEEDAAPVLVTDSNGMMWIVSVESIAEARYIILGPFFIDSRSILEAENQLSSYQLTRVLREGTLSFLRRLPIIPSSHIQEYAIMLHYLLKDEKIGADSLHYLSMHNQELTVDPELLSSVAPEMTRSEVWGAEQEMMRMIQEGDLSSTGYMEELILRLTRVAPLSVPGRRQKDWALTAIVLFCRAAVKGGVDPDTALTIADFYIRNAEICETSHALADLVRTMHEDYVKRVHKCRQNAAFSKTVQACRNYIDTHLEDPVLLGDIAGQLGYAAYYLSKKYKKETGESISQYLRSRRLERGAFLLAHTGESIQGISERLHFSSPSYFSDLFRKSTGLTPSEYREKMRHS